MTTDVFILTRTKAKANFSSILEDELTSRGINCYRVTSNHTPARRVENIKAIINYGNSTVPAWVDRIPRRAVWLNSPSQIVHSSHKIRMFQSLSAAGIPCVPTTTSQAEAQDWLDRGDDVFSRTVLTGHSGAGIVLSPPDPLPSCPLYTKRIGGENIREYRAWFVNGQCIDLAEKQRYSAERREAASIGDGEYERKVRTNANGWVFARDNMRFTDQQFITNNVLPAIPLVWGCVDLLINYSTNRYWVIETNTAPGLRDSRTKTSLADSLAAFCNAL
jgi:hypothetical protein